LLRSVFSLYAIRRMLESPKIEVRLLQIQLPENTMDELSKLESSIRCKVKSALRGKGYRLRVDDLTHFYFDPDSSSDLQTLKDSESHPNRL